MPCFDWVSASLQRTLAKAEKDNGQISDYFQVCQFRLQRLSEQLRVSLQNVATIRCMSESTEVASSTPEPEGRRRVPLLSGRSLSQNIIAIIAVIALLLAGWALLRSGAGFTADYSDQQRAEAKTKACAAVDLVRRGVKLNTSIPVPGGSDDVVGMLAAGANARLSAYAGGLYLTDQLDPATPSGLADQIREFADLLKGIGANATAGASDSDPDQAARLKAADAANTNLGKACVT